jgi:hypothetical protein
MWVRAQQSNSSASGRLLQGTAKFDFDAIMTLTVQIVEVVQKVQIVDLKFKQGKIEFGSSICENRTIPQQADGVSNI